MAEQEKEFEGQEFTFPDEQEVNQVQKPEVQVEASNADIEIEIEDDTPPQDRGREPLPQEMVEALEKDDLTDYSERVKERMSQLKKVWHDERRAKEAAAREREEAIRYAQQVMEENKRLKSSLSTGEETYVSAITQAAEHELTLAKKEYREAYDSGDPDRLIEAQQKLTEAQFKLGSAKNYKPRYENTLQEEQNSVERQQQPQQTVVRDPKAEKWLEKNSWYGENRLMTSAAWGMHEELVLNGVDPRSDEYYRRLDETMRELFPKYFGKTTENEEKPVQRKPSTVVAPATRSTAPKKVHLSTSELTIAKRLGITPEQYARETLKLEKR